MVNGDVEVSNYELVVARFVDYVIINHVPIAVAVSLGRIYCYYFYQSHNWACNVKLDGVSAINFCEV